MLVLVKIDDTLQQIQQSNDDEDEYEEKACDWVHTEWVLKTQRVCWPDWQPEARARMWPSDLQTEHPLRDGRG